MWNRTIENLGGGEESWGHMWCVSRISINQEGVVRGISCVTELLKQCSPTLHQYIPNEGAGLLWHLAEMVCHLPDTHSFLEASINSLLLGKTHLGDNVFFDCVLSFVPHDFGRYLPVGWGQTSTCELVPFHPCCRIILFQVSRCDNNYQLLSTYTS